MTRLLVTTPRGSGGAVKHFRKVLPLIQRDRPDWRMELHAPTELLRAAFGRDDLPWMCPVASSRYVGRLRWEMVEMPDQVEREPGTLVYSPFGPLLNLAAAQHAVWASRNVIPLLPPETWEVMDGDRGRMLALRYLVAWSARIAPRTICVSDHARASLMQLAGLSGKTIRSIPHGVDAVDADVPCQDPRAESVRHAPYILNVGQPALYRRTRELIVAYGRLAERRKDLPRLVLVGVARDIDREYGQECLRLAQPLERAGRAVLLGQLGHGDALALTARAEVVAYPSVHEDCPNVVLEAMAAGRVTVCADIPAVRELADDGALYVRNPDPASIERVLETAVYDGSLRSRLTSHASARAALFTWERTADSTIRVLEEAFEVLDAR